ncbi:efflux RND transporter periplasmic adaptor subunit [Thiolapillus sp.]|uniref:efflux RND transporter periplasmic adaptor subunit n=1 Tax=Thiolapillus sp. TaxID=2017437 RepID=UPI003AF841D8
MPGHTRLLLVLLLAALTACSDSKPPAKASQSHKSPAVLVEIAEVQEQPVAKTWKRSGTLVYRHILRVHTQEEGRITRLPWFEGNKVRKGDTLATLDNELLQAELRKARATSSMAERKVSRLERLRKTKATSEEDLVEAQTELELARAEVEILMTRMGYTTIKAPYDGVIIDRLVEPGDAVPRNTHLLTLADPASLVVRVPASEQMLADLGTDSRVLMYPDIPGAAPIAGRLQRIFPTLDPQSRQGTLEIALPDSPGGMRAGQFVRVQVAGALKKRLLIPYTALRTDRRGEYVYVVKNGRVARKDIISGQRFDDLLEIVKGLQPGENIVKRGFMNLKSDTPVTVVNKD